MTAIDSARFFHATIGGRDVETTDTFDVINPATGQAFAQAPAVSMAKLDEAFETGKASQVRWREDDAYRREVLHKAADTLAAAADDLGPVLTSEQGKPLASARGEFLGAAVWMRYFADLEI